MANIRTLGAGIIFSLISIAILFSFIQSGIEHNNISGLLATLCVFIPVALSAKLLYNAFENN